MQCPVTEDAGFEFRLHHLLDVEFEESPSSSEPVLLLVNGNISVSSVVL